MGGSRSNKSAREQFKEAKAKKKADEARMRTNEYRKKKPPKKSNKGEIKGKGAIRRLKDKSADYMKKHGI